MGDLAPQEVPERTLEGATLEGRYRVDATLGVGGMATVYLAEDVRLERKVVVKSPHPALLQEPDFARRFRREIASLTKVEHQHVVKVHDTGSHAGLPYAVLQYLSGGSLRDRLEAGGGRLEAPQVLPWLLQTADALDHIHARGLVHRDVKPGNILYDEAGNAVLADFGIAKAIGATDTGITTTGVTPGSPGYMAPEVIRGGELGPRYDQFSLACMVYEALAGRLPFAGATAMELLGALLRDEPRDLAPLAPELPLAAAQTVMRALSKDPERRFATCTEFAKTFQAALGVPTIEVFPRQFAAALRRRRWLRAGLAAGTVAAAAVAGALLAPRGEWATSSPAPGAEPAASGAAPETPRPPLGEPPWPLVRPEGAPPDLRVSQAQIEEAARLGVPVWFENSIGMRFVLIPAGKFVMGTPDSDPDRIEFELSPREVAIPRAFYVQTTEVTNGQVRKWHPDRRNPRIGTNMPPTDADDQPACGMGAASVKEFLDWLGRDGERRYRLPTEAEWECAARAGTTGPVYWPGGHTDIGRHANVCDRRALAVEPTWRGMDDVDDGFPAAAPVASFLPNPWGLYDVIGNANELCRPVEGDALVMRGGAWNCLPQEPRLPWRCPREAGREPVNGFRLVVELPSVAVESPAADGALDEGAVVVVGTASGAAAVRVNGVTGDVKDGSFEVTITLPPGEQEIEAVAGAISTVRKVSVAAVPRPEAGWPGVPEWAKVSKQQVDEARRLGVDVAFENSLGMRLVLIPAGALLMRASGCRVTQTRAFYLQTTEVTNAQMRCSKPERHSSAKGTDGDDQPAPRVAWDEAVGFAKWLVENGDGRVYRLPREAEWEYACRAGTKGRFWWGEDESLLPRYANVADQSAGKAFPNWQVSDFDDGHPMPAPVASYEPNPWGLFDMLGNAIEWCQDWGAELPGTPQVDPTGPAAGTAHLLRGSGWNAHASDVGVDRRGWDLKPTWVLFVGFRLVAEVPSGR